MSIYSHMLRMAVITAVLCLVISPLNAIGAELYVSTTGNDETGDGTSSYPYATIQKGITESSDGDTVIVRDGTYTGPGNYDIDFLGKAITVRSENGYESCIVDCDGHDGFKIDGESFFECVLRDFTIVNGRAGILFGSLGFAASIITNNELSNNEYGIWLGGSIADTTYIIDNIIQQNDTGIYIESCKYFNISSNEITHNINDGIISYISTVSFNERQRIYNNQISYNGRYGIHCGHQFLSYIDTNTITHNGSGGINTFVQSTPNIINNVIAYNSGFGIALVMSEGDIFNNLISGNSEGGIILYGNIENPINIFNNTIVNNLGTNGAGIFAEDMKGNTVEFKNNIIHNFGDNEIFISSHSFPSAVEISHCNIKNNAIVENQGVFGVTLTLGDGIISDPPQFVNSPADDYRLLNTSPCIGAGTSVGAPATDILGVTRGTPPDMGAYENGLDEPIYVVSEQDSLALVALYNSTDGPNWTDNTNWLTSNPVDTWYGISVSEGEVTDISLYNNLTGTIPSEIGDLTQLTYIWLWNNQLTGSIPSTIGNLTNLYLLDARNNLLTGSIPLEIGNMTNLHELHLSGNQLSGSIPLTISNLQELVRLDLSNNELSGSIPSGLDNSNEFFELNLSNNNLSGPIPPEIKDWDLFEESIIFIDNNQFTFNDIASSGILPGDNQDFVYAPQDTLPAPSQTATDSTISLSIPPGHAQNQYQWFVDDEEVAGGIARELTIQIGDIGTYMCRITNPLYPELTLWTHELLVTPPKELAIVTPDGDTQWEAGTSHTIEWTSTSIDTILLEYSHDGGENWYIITESADAAAGSYEWAVPDISSTNYLVRITDTEDSNYTDQNDAPFTIYQPTIIVSAPNGGETWQAGTSQAIKWGSEWVEEVKIEYSVDSGESWFTIITTTDASTGSYAWTLPDNPSTTCMVKITDASDAELFDASNAVFTIDAAPGPSSITVLSPNGGEQYEVWTTQLIQWSSTNVDSVRIEYSVDGSEWYVARASVSAASGSQEWTVPNTPSDEVLMRIRSLAHPEVSDMTDEPFTIYRKHTSDPKSVNILSPNGGEVWAAGSQQEIVWEWSYIWDFVIEYSIDNGTHWTHITYVDIEFITPPENPSEFSYKWTVPDTASTECLIRMRGISDPTVTDQSDATFTITSDDPTMVESEPSAFLTVACYPNPFNPLTTISYQLPQPAVVTISIFNALGQQVREYPMGRMEPGIHEVVFDATELTSGLYFHRVDAGQEAATGKMLYMK